MSTAEITVTRQDIRYSTTLATLCCGSCSIPFAIPADRLDKLQTTGDWFWCPNGHQIHYSESEEQKLKKQLAASKRRADGLAKDAEGYLARITHEADQRRAAERQVTAYKGTVTRMKKRTAAGICPCCQRTFQQLARHMAGQHPGYEATS
jgi:hypothetical protein